MKKEFEHINWNILSRCLSGEATSKEREELECWLSASDKHQKIYDALVNLEIKREIFNEVNRLNVEQTLQHIKTKSEKIRIFNLRPLMRIAAVLVLAVGLTFITRHVVTSSMYMVVNTGNNERLETLLDDGTLITMNENTYIKYPKKIAGKARKVYLEGEAFFNVARDSLHPFIINTDKVYVKVLGTEFNVESYDNVREVIVTVQKGKVEFGMKKRSANNSCVLTIGNEGRFNKDDNTIQYVETSSVNQLAWKTKYLVFRDETLDNVIQKLEEVYLVEFNMDEMLTKRKLNAVYNNQPIDSIVEILESTLNINIHKTDNNIYEINMN